MTERSLLILYVCCATFVVVVYIAVLLIWRHRKTERAIDAAREQLYTVGESNDIAHETMHREMKKASGRLQFLTARSIADELGERQEAAAKPKDGE